MRVQHEAVHTLKKIKNQESFEIIILSLQLEKCSPNFAVNLQKKVVPSCPCFYAFLVNFTRCSE